MKAWGVALPLSLILVGAARAQSASPLVNSCRAAVSVSYPQAPTSSSVGDLLRVEIKLGARTIGGGTTFSVHRVRFNLDCDSSYPLGINCLDEGAVVSYQGGLTSNCGVGFSSSHDPGDTFPNQVVFTPDSSIAIPAHAESYCSLEFDVRVETFSSDFTPAVIEQLAGFDATMGDGACDTTPATATGRTNTGQICLAAGCLTTSTSCEALTELAYPASPRLLEVGATVRAHVVLGGGPNGNGASISVYRARFNLDCDNSSLGISCLDDGGIVSFQGNVATTCPTTWTASHGQGDAFPNQVVFTPNGALQIPSSTPSFCSLDFDVRVESLSNDMTPSVIEQVVGMDENLETPSASSSPSCGRRRQQRRPRTVSTL